MSGRGRMPEASAASGRTSPISNTQDTLDEDESFCSNLNLRLSTNASALGTSVDLEENITSIRELMEYIDSDMDPGKRLSKIGREGFKTRVMTVALELANLAGQNKILKEEMERLRKEAKVEKTSYAKVTAQPAMVARTDTEKKIAMRGEDNTLFITCDKATTGKKGQEELTKVLNPRTSRVRINRMKATGKALIIEAASKEDLEKIKNHDQVKKHFKCELPRKRKPLVIIYDVSSSAKEEDVIEDIRSQNFENMTEEQFAEGFKIRFKTGPRGRATVHYVAEVSPDIRNRLIRNRIHIGFSAVNAKDYIVVAKCMKCQDLGHVAKHCTKEMACGHCGNAHECKNCDKTGQAKICIPCKSRGKANCGKEQRDCPTYKMLVDRLIQKTDYGS
ncbi:uncharacterized protein LOC114339398 [Diabrotica virgifera virgifera]|uniref:Uncharacterized protein LOC114339398 n=1 Tax=Diabrotica virgifera virgifera TaxID=50390 RepID=A0A6P7G9G1_DIAVI|nr:uncharacterized protein LOC114339398 [Diabrotica virgifera virgifera]